MVDVEIIDFKAPSSASKLVFLSQVESDDGVQGEALTHVLTEHFSRWGLVHSVRVLPSDDQTTHIAYVRYFSARATASARRHNQGQVRLQGLSVRFRVTPSRSQSIASLPLSRSSCEELANYYLGFNGWSSEILYHRREEGGEVAPDNLCYVTVVRLTFSQSGLDCEGAGKCEAPKEDYKTNVRLMTELAKRSKGEAIQAAWEKVLLVVVDGKKVSVEINSNKKDSFFYDPTWDEPCVEVNGMED